MREFDYVAWLRWLHEHYFVPDTRIVNNFRCFCLHTQVISVLKYNLFIMWRMLIEEILLQFNLVPSSSIY